MEPDLRTPDLQGDSAGAKRNEIAAYFNATFDRYTSLFETLACDEAYYEKPISLRHPLIFYYGHTATFFVNKMILAGLIEQRINPRLESMFAVGVDEMSWDDLDETHYEWPSVQEVRDYRGEVKGLVNQFIRQSPLSLPIGWEDPWWVILMGIEHEQIHLETSSVLIRQQRIELVQPHDAWRPCDTTATAPANDLVSIPGGKVRLGKALEDPHYGWDNEYGHHEADVESFQTSRLLVSNQEFMEFVNAGGYTTDRLWLPEGLEWRNYAGADCPTFWIRQEDGWQLRLMTEVVDMPWDWPVEVNYHEANAFCSWKSAQTGLPVRVPTEDEWYRIFDHTGRLEPAAGELADANLHLDHFASSCPVNRFAHGDLYDVTGNVWQWTETAMYPFDGFQVHPLYDDFTTPTFDQQHNLMKGGSWISCGNEALKSSRYAFRRHFFQHAGFRYVVTDASPEQSYTGYETERMLSEYAEFHYGDTYYDVPNFPRALARIAIEAMGDRPARKALDLGCAVGRATFELAEHFQQVTGIDFSARFINLGVQLASQGVIRYAIADEGDLVLYRERQLADLDLGDVADRVEFFQGDACNLKDNITGFDLIVAANLIDRLYDPGLFLRDIHQRLNPGGILLIASPYTWLEEHTEKDKWLGGFKQDGENVTTLDGLKGALLPHFDLMQAPRQVPFVIRETSRKFQHTLSDVTLWLRR